MLEHRPQVPGSQHWQGRPALAQEQVREEQEASGKQKQQRSSRASAVFCRLSFLLLKGVAVNADGERPSSSVLTTPIVCSWRRLAASVASPGALGGSGSRSLSESVDVVVRSSIFNVGISIQQVKNPRPTMVMSKFKR